MRGFGWLKSLFATKPQPTPRSASVKCVCCEGWSHSYTAYEMEKSAADYQEGTDFMHWTCGRCSAVSEWFMGAPVALFTRMVVYGTTLSQLRMEVEDLQAEYNLLLLTDPVKYANDKPDWDKVDDLDYNALLVLKRMKRRTIDQLKTIE